MRKTITSLMALVVTMIFATSAMAQKKFTGSVDCYSTAGYSQKYITFSLTEIAEALDTDTATLVAAFNDQVQNYVYSIFEVQNVDPIFFNLPDGTTKSAYYTQGTVGGFWMDENSNVVEWGENTGARWFNTLSWSAEKDLLYIGIGQYPNANQPEDHFSTTFVLEFNEKFVRFEVSLNVTEKPAVDVTPILSKLTIINGEKPITATVEQYVRTVYDADAIKVGLDGAAEKLGLDEATLAENLADYLYCTNYDVTNDVIKDSLTNVSTAKGLGWWLTETYDEETGEPTGECAAVPYGTKNFFYVQKCTYSEDSLSFEFGQSPSTLVAGNSYYVNLYLINGTKAVRIKAGIDVKVKPKSDVTFDQMTRVGGEEVSFLRDPSLGYGASTYYFDADSIAALFGEDVAASDLAFQALTTENELTDSYTANGGFWMDLESHTVSWGSGTKIYFAEYTYSSASSYFNIGNMETQDFVLGTVTAGSVFLVYDDKYYEFAMRVQMGEKEDSTATTYTVDECKTVATYKYEYQIVPNSEPQDYTCQDTTIFLDMTEVESLLGTSSPAFYAETYADSTGNIFSKAYSCTPFPGFWMDPDTLNEHHSVASVWGSTNTYGISFTNDYFQFFQYPNSSSVAVGNSYTDNFYLVNLKSGKKIKYIITVKYVEELTKHANVGQMNLAGKSRGEDGEFNAFADVDLTAMYTAFGCTAEEFAAVGSWIAPNQAGTYTEDNYDEAEGFFFDAEGKTVDDGTEVLHVGINEDGQLATWVINDTDLENVYTVSFAALYNDQMYYFYVTVNQDGVPDAIDGIKDNTVKSGVIYDLSGRKVITPSKGVYIQNGKKFIIK